jgi:integrase/recombinase XerD
MSLGRQAKVLTETQVKVVLSALGDLRFTTRNQVMFLLSVDAGLRAKEISSLTWEMVTDPEGNVTDTIALTDTASKGRSGGAVPMSQRLQAALQRHKDFVGRAKGPVALSKYGKPMAATTVVQWFCGLYARLGYEGCSSHSGRRTAITKWARKISSVGGSLRDVQSLARHSSLAMTQRYIEISADAMRKVVG